MPSMQITATQGGSTSAGLVLRVFVLTQAAATQNGATANTQTAVTVTHTLSITTTQTGSRVYGASAPTPNSSAAAAALTTVIDAVADTTHGEEYVTFKATSLTGTPGATTLGFTSGSSGTAPIAMAEIRTAGTLTEDGSAPAVASTTAATTVTTALFTPPAGSLLVALVGSDGGAAVTTMTVSGGGLTWTEQVKNNPSGGDYAGVWLAQVPAATAATAPLMRPQLARRLPVRARLGRLGLCAAGIASQIVTPLGTQQPHKPPVPVTRPAPHRAHAGPMGACGAGHAGPQPAVAAPVTAYQRPGPKISRRPPQRAVWRGLASQVVTPRGTPGPSWRPQPRRPAPARGYWHGNAGPPSAAVTPAAQAYQRPPPQVRRPGPARARLGPAGSAGDGVTGLANAQAAAAVSPPRLPPQARRPVPARGQWRGFASQVVTPLGTPARRPGPQITSRPRTRAIWRGIAGTIAPPVTALPKWRPLPSRRGPQRARTGGVRGLTNALPPSLQNATSSPAVTAADTSAATVAGAAHGASVAAQGTSAAAVTDPRDGTSSVTPAASSTPSASDG